MARRGIYEVQAVMGNSAVVTAQMSGSEVDRLCKDMSEADGDRRVLEYKSVDGGSCLIKADEVVAACVRCIDKEPSDCDESLASADEDVTRTLASVVEGVLAAFRVRCVPQVTVDAFETALVAIAGNEWREGNVVWHMDATAVEAVSEVLRDVASSDVVEGFVAASV